LKIEPREKDKPIYVLGSEGPVITIDLKENETCVIKKLILAHSGANMPAQVT
jgi:hypothetical protein